MGQRVDVDLVLFVPIGAHNDGSDISSAVDLIDTRPAGATKIIVQTVGQNIRYTLDGTNPTATKGFRIRADDPPFIITLAGVNSLKIIEEAATADFQYQWGR